MIAIYLMLNFSGIVPMKHAISFSGKRSFLMKITDSSVMMESQRIYAEKFEEHTDLKFWISPTNNPVTDQVSISQEARACAGCNSDKEDGLSQGMEFEVSLEKLITELLSGRKVKIIRTEDLSQDDDKSEEPVKYEDPGQRSEGWGLDYSHETVYQEQESVDFDAGGIIKTSDGRELNFTLHLSMNREYIERNSIRIRAGDALKDPLVINFDGTAAQFGDSAVGFDIDADGADESLPGLSAGKGYLSIDINGDGIINNGTELFGPTTGNGFSELSSYDNDGNGWIDENDDVYKKLSILSFNDAGGQVLQAIRGLGVGAIYTSSSQTPFDIKDQQSGDLLGRIKSSGVFIAENGLVGTIQQIDLKI